MKNMNVVIIVMSVLSGAVFAAGLTPVLQMSVMMNPGTKFNCTLSMNGSGKLVIYKERTFTGPSSKEELLLFKESREVEFKGDLLATLEKAEKGKPKTEKRITYAAVDEDGHAILNSSFYSMSLDGVHWKTIRKTTLVEQFRLTESKEATVLTQMLDSLCE